MAFPASAAQWDNNTIIFNFIDVEQNFWASDAIHNLAKSGILKGYPDNTFKPDNPVTREEFATLIAKTFYLDLPAKDKQATFQDVQNDRWSFSYVEASKEFLTGYYPPSGRAFFSPEMDATREDVAVALVKAMAYTEDDLQNPNILYENFYDADEVSPNLQTYVALAIEKKLFSGYPDGSFRPNQGVTRAEAAALLYRVLKSATTDGNKDLELIVSAPETTQEETLYITGTVTKGASVTINNEPVDVQYGKFSKGFRFEDEGTYEFVVSARLPGGKTKTVTKQVRFERGGPTLKIDNLPTTSSAATITVSGSVSDDGDGYPDVYLNDELISNGWSNRFSTEVTLQEGENILVFKAVNRYGKETVIEKKVIVTLGGPVIKFDYIPETTTQSEITLSGKIEDPNDDYPKLYLNDQQINAWGGSFSVRATLKDGENVFTFVASNEAGKRTTVTKRVFLQSDAPTLRVDDIPATTEKQQLRISWTVSDKNDTDPKVYVNDEPVFWGNSKDITLNEGPNTITVKAINKYGKSTVVTKTVILTGGAPTLTLGYLPDTTENEKVRLTWNVSDQNDTNPQVYVQGELIAWSNSKEITLTEGVNKIEVLATNKLGKSTKVEKTIIFTPQAPVLNVDEIPATTSESTYRITWTVFDSNDRDVKVYVNNERVEWSNSKTVALQDGENTLEIKAVNKYGKTTVVTRTITKTN
jgi:hypothetical protein